MTGREADWILRWGLTPPPFHVQDCVLRVMWQETPAARILNRSPLENCAVEAVSISARPRGPLAES